MSTVKPFGPLVAAILSVVLQAVLVALPGGVTAAEVVTIVLALAGAVTTYVIPSVSGQWPWAKTVVAALTASLVTLSDALGSGGGFDAQTILTAVIALLVGLGGTALTEPAARDYALAA